VNQLSLSPGGPPPPSDLPAVVAAILHAARSTVFSARVVRGYWGVGLGPKRRWVLTGDCCCALSAYLIAQEAVAYPNENSPRATVMRLLGITGEQLDSFIHGFDSHWWYAEDDPDPEWYGYGERVAKEVVAR